MTHNQRVLELLSDGKPHSHHELYALHVVGHSRIADLRKQGHRIEQWREGDLYLYRLLGEGVEVCATPASSPSGTGQTVGSQPLLEQPDVFALECARVGDSPPVPLQLTLDAA